MDVFQRACEGQAAKLLGVERVTMILKKDTKWEELNEIQGVEEEVVKLKVSDVLDFEDSDHLDPEGVETFTLITGGIIPFVRGEYHDFFGSSTPHFYLIA